MASRGVNRVIIVGNVGEDPEQKFLPSGGAVTNISVATSEQWKDKNTGQPQEKTEWHRIVFFNKLAEIVGQYVKKGSKIYIEGSLRTRSWEQDGIKRYATEIVASEMQMLDSKGGESQSQESAARTPPQPRENRSASAPAPVSGGGGFDDFDDVPFAQYMRDEF